VRNRLVQIALSIALLVILIQVVLIAPSQIRDSVARSGVENKAALLPETPSAPTPKGAAPGGDIDQVINGMHTIETQEGSKEWELWSDKATSFKSTETVELETVRAIFFSDNGVTFTVTGQKGRVQQKTKNMRVEGDVVTRSSNGYVFRTALVEYDSATRQLVAPGHVTMVGPQDPQGHALRLTGSSMQASVKDTTIEVRRDVRAEKTLEGGRIAYIRSQKAFFTGRDKTAKFSGDVILDMDSMRITGPQAQFEYDSKGDTVRSVVFTGGARVSDSDKWATANNVKVDFESNRFVFRGNPRVVQNNDELRGDEIVFLDGGKRVQVKSARAKVDQKRLEKSN
jgi:LPS export ABC transporter protein LptC/lipopolysaccharide transport protein LptA